jgi:tRNA(Phe) wybutosine-synthesizing methylase Tyw3
MSQPSQPQLPRRLSLSASPEVEAGVYADFVSVWHQPHLFVLDFSVHTNPPQVIEVEGQKVVNVPARMVTRVRIRPEQIFEIMKALNQQLSRWEKEQGRLPRREEPPPSPPES